MLEKTTRMNQLYDRYGSLLSEKQQQYMELYYLDDLSLGEIAEEVEVSRQAVYDQIRRAEASLELFEERIKLLEKSGCREKLLQDLERIVLNDPATSSSDQIKEILHALREID